jgi:hypothetical protein
MSPRIALALTIGLLLAVGMTRAVGASSQVDDRGNCEREWEWKASDLLRGPKALLMMPTAPLRSLAGGIQLVPEFWKTAKVPSGVMSVPAAVGAATGLGCLEGVSWGGAGLLDLLTGGVFQIAPDRATELSVMPMRPIFMPPSPAPATTEPCGRPQRRLPWWP